MLKSADQVFRVLVTHPDLTKVNVGTHFERALSEALRQKTPRASPALIRRAAMWAFASRIAVLKISGPATNPPYRRTELTLELCLPQISGFKSL